MKVLLWKVWVTKWLCGWNKATGNRDATAARRAKLSSKISRFT